MVHQRDARVCQRTLCKTPCQYKVYNLRSYIQDVMHVILDKSAQIGATLTPSTSEIKRLPTYVWMPKPGSLQLQRTQTEKKIYPPLSRLQACQKVLPIATWQVD